MAQPSAPTRSPKPTPTPTSAQNVAIPWKTLGAGKSSKPLSQTAPTPTTGSTQFFAVVDAKAFSSGLGRALNTTSQSHRDTLANELSKPGGPDMALVRHCLRGLVAENTARCNGKTPDALHIYMGFGDVSNEDRRDFLKVLRALGNAAAALKGQLGDPQCEEMLGWITDHWESYEQIHTQKKTDPSDAKDYRKSMLRTEASLPEGAASESDDEPVAPLKASKPLPRVGAGASQQSTYSVKSREEISTASEAQELQSPRRHKTTDAGSTASTSTQATTAHKAVITNTSTRTATTTNTLGVTNTMGMGPRKLRSPLELATQKTESRQAQEDLKDPAEILRRAKARDALFAALEAEDFPAVTSLLNQLPSITAFHKYFPKPSPDRSYEKLHATAMRYAQAHSGQPLESFLRTCGQRAKAYRIVQKQMELHPDMLALYKPEVYAVCNALATTSEEHVQANTKALEQLIKAAMKLPNLKELLAQQPFASLKTLEHQCLQLEQHTKGKTVRAFHQIAQEARAVQMSASSELRNELLKDTLNEAKLKPLVRKEIARQFADSPADYVSEGATWIQVEAIFESVKTLHKRAVNASEDGSSWEIRMLAQLVSRVEITLKKIRPQNDDDY